MAFFLKKKSTCESSRVSHANLCFLLRYLMTSWASTVFMDSSYSTGYFSITSWMLKGGGILSAMPPTISSTICSAGRTENSANVNVSQEIPAGLHSICQTLIPDPRCSYLLTGFAPSESSSRLQASHGSQQGKGLILGEADVSIVMQAEDLRCVVDGQTTDVRQVTLREKWPSLAVIMITSFKGKHTTNSTQSTG